MLQCEKGKLEKAKIDGELEGIKLEENIKGMKSNLHGVELAFSNLPFSHCSMIILSFLCLILFFIIQISVSRNRISCSLSLRA
jgi:hypothetical protein